MARTNGTSTADVVVVGGGVAGLAAATYAGRAGASVLVLDARRELGGRARTAVVDGFHFNEGPHALYRASEGMATLRELGITPKGGNPPFVRTRLSIDGDLVVVPPRTALRQVLGLARRLKADAGDPGLVRLSAAEWIDGRVGDRVGRQLAAALVRVSSYCGDLTTFSADAAARQAHAAMRGVMYLHGGWAQLVDSLDGLATGAGVTIDRGVKVGSVRRDGERWVVTSGDGPAVAARAVVIATGGATAASRLLGETSPTLARAAADARPVHAACLDLGLDGLPKNSVRFVLGVDRPTYASIHTPGARLADDSGHVVHVMTYEPADEVDVADLELTMDELQPGWQGHEVARQVGRRRVVAFDRPQPGAGMAGRPGISVAELPGLLVAGDWVGPDDLLGGAALTSGRAAGRAAAAVDTRRMVSAR